MQKKSVMFCNHLLLVGALFVSGCLSYTCSTVSYNNTLSQPSSVRYFVRAVKLSPVATVYPFGSYKENQINGNLRAQKIREAFARYSPHVFAASSEGAVPIDVTINVRKMGMNGLDLLTSFLCGFTYGILPGRISNDLYVTVDVKLSDGFAVTGNSQVVAHDDRAEYTLMFYSPVNLILAPVSEKFNGCRTFGGDTYDWYPTKQLGDIVRTALARFDQKKLQDALEHKVKKPVAPKKEKAPVAVPAVSPTPQKPSQSVITAEEIPL